MLMTLGQIQNSRVVQVANVSPESAEFLSLVNEGVDELMRRGNWFGTVQPMQGCVYDDCVVWPRYVAAVLALNNRCRHTTVANHWYQFIDWSAQWHGSLYDDFRRFGRRGVTISNGTLPVFNPIPCGQMRAVRFYVDSKTDIGKTIVVYGKDENGQSLWGKRSDGTYQEGLVLTLGIPYIQSPTQLQSVQRIVKDPTNNKVRGYSVDSAGNLYDMAVYDASETSPDYIRTKVTRNCCGGMITALVKLAFVPMLYPDDLCPIENIEALENIVHAKKKKEAGELAESLELQKEAIRALNYEMRTRYPDEQFLVNFKPFGSDELNNWRTRIGMV